MFTDVLMNQPRKLVDGRPNETDLFIPLVDGRGIRMAGADRYDNLRGGGPVACAMDEFAFQDPRCWTEVVAPALSDKVAPALFTSTPNGQNHFYRLWRRGQEGNPGWKSWTIPTGEAGTVPPEELDEKSRSLPRDTFAQEYMAEFLGHVGSVNPYFIPKTYPEGNLFPMEQWDAFIGKASVFGALDWGIRNDTVHTWFACDTEGRVVAFDEYAAKGRTVREVSNAIKTRNPRRPGVVVLDKTCWRREGGSLKTIAGQFILEGIPVTPSDSRIPDSVSQLRSMTTREGDGMPRFMILENTCPVGLEQEMLLQYNEKAVEDEGKFDGPHDAFDTHRYGIMFGGRADAEVLGKPMLSADKGAVDFGDSEEEDFSPVSGLPRW